MNKSEEEQSISYVCSSCHKQPMEPVVTECGHMFCWACLYSNETKQCSVCESSIQPALCYPVFIQKEQRSQNEPNDRPPRPAPVYRERILNPGMGNAQMPLGLSNLPNNIPRKKRVAGSNYFPSVFINTFNSFEDFKPGQADYQVSRCCKFSLIIATLLSIIVALCLLL